MGFDHVHGRNSNKRLVSLKRCYMRKSCFESSIIELFKLGATVSSVKRCISNKFKLFMILKLF